MIVQKCLKHSLFTLKIKLRCPVTFLIWPQPAFPSHLFAPLHLSSGEPGSPPGRSVLAACSSSVLYIPSIHCLPLAKSFATSRSCLNMACSLLDPIWVELITPSSATGSLPAPYRCSSLTDHTTSCCQSWLLDKFLRRTKSSPYSQGLASSHGFAIL